MILPYCDELVLVDTGSTDTSLDILRQRSLPYFDFTWIDDFSAARNFALSQARGEWILSLDIDERLRGEDLLQLRALISKSDASAYSLSCVSLKTMNWTSHDLQIHSINDSNTFVRLFRNGLGIQFQNPIHETVVPSLEAKNFGFTQIDTKVYHLGYAGSRYEEKIERNKGLLDKHFEQMGREPSFVYYYAQSHWNGEIKILDLLVEAFNSSSGNLRVFLAESVYGWLMEFPLKVPRKPEDDVEVWEKIVSTLNPDSPMLWLRKARAAFVGKDESEALLWYEKIHKVLNKVSEIQFFRAEILYNLGFLYSCKQRFEEALACYQEFESVFGPDPFVFHQCLKIYGVLGNPQKLLECAKNPPENLQKLSPEKKSEVRKILNHFFAKTHAELVEKVDGELG